MNNTESKKLHDLMQAAFDRSCNLTSPKNYYPVAIGEFAKELVTNFLLDECRKMIAEIAKQELAAVVEVRVATLNELGAAIELLENYRSVIPELSFFLNQVYEIKRVCPEDSTQLVFDLEPIIKKAVNCFLFDRSKDHSMMLEKFARIDDKKNIVEFVFSPSLSKLYNIIDVFERKKKASLYNSYHYLNQAYLLYYDLEGRSSKIGGFLLNNHHSGVFLLNSDVQKFDQALEEQKSEKAIALGFDMEECKVHVDRVWKFLKPKLIKLKTKSNRKMSRFLNNQIFNYQYHKKDGRGFLTKESDDKVIGELIGISAQLLSFMLKSKPISKSDIADEIATPEYKTKPSEQVRNAIRVVNLNLNKYFPDKVIIYDKKKQLWTINPLYRHYIILKK